MFELHPALKKKDFVCDLDLCTVLLEDNAAYPWIFLVPKLPGIHSMRDLTHEQRLCLMTEIEKAETAMAALFHPVQTNVAMIGNLTPQLHVHVICRFENDPAWPGTVWGENAVPYASEVKKEIISQIQHALKGEPNV